MGSSGALEISNCIPVRLVRLYVQLPRFSIELSCISVGTMHMHC